MGRILLAHADTDDREMYAEFLRAHGMDVAEVGRTDAAIDILHRCDVLIVGLRAPGSISPLELIAGSKGGRWGKPLPTIVLTTLFPADQRDAIRAGADQILLKPCCPSDLLAVVRQALSRGSA